MPEPWVSVDEVASHLGVAKDSVYRWIEQKGLPAHRVGRLWKFKLSEIDKWVHSGGADGSEASNSGVAARSRKEGGLPSRGMHHGEDE
jgi:excisionase family DNA binding protein